MSRVINILLYLRIITLVTSLKLCLQFEQREILMKFYMNQELQPTRPFSLMVKLGTLEDAIFVGLLFLSAI